MVVLLKLMIKIVNTIKCRNAQIMKSTANSCTKKLVDFMNMRITDEYQFLLDHLD